MNHLERMSTLGQNSLIYANVMGYGPTWVRVSDSDGVDVDGDLFCIVVKPSENNYISDCIYVNEDNIIAVFNDIIDELTMI